MITLEKDNLVQPGDKFNLKNNESNENASSLIQDHLNNSLVTNFPLEIADDFDIFGVNNEQIFNEDPMKRLTLKK